MQKSRIYNIMFNAAVLTVLACIGFASCTSDEPDIIDRERYEITFANPVISGMTRAGGAPGAGSEVGVAGEITTYPKEERFIVIGKKYPQGNYLGWEDPTSQWEFEPAVNVNVEEQRDKVFYNSLMDTWKTKKLHFWEEGKDYTFAAYSPARVRNDANHQVSYGKEGLQILGFVPAPVLNDQYDLMYAERSYGINRNTGQNVPGTGNPNVYNGVNIKFKHALAAIHFKVCMHPDMVNSNPEIKEGDYTIQSIEMKGFGKNGNFKENITSENNTDKTTYVANPTWELLDVNVNGYNFLPAAGISLKLPPKGAVSINDAAVDIKESYYGGYSALLIPQTLEASAVVVITWTRKGQTDPVVTTLALKDYTKEWKMGYRYTYTIAFSEDLIFFSPNISKIGDDGILVI